MMTTISRFGHAILQANHAWCWCFCSLLTLLSSLFFALGVFGISPALAHAKEPSYLILGADLTQSQQSRVVSCLGLNSKELKAAKQITVTNKEEHKRCDKSIPKSVTGKRTLSCAYLKLAKKGGIKVKVHNLTYVTKDSLRNALQTAGIENCELTVDAPLKVSGTGALTGVFKACKKLDVGMDSKKEDAAVEELYEMSGFEQKYGKGFAQAISAAKDAVISQGDSLTGNDIESIVKRAASACGIDMEGADVLKVSEYLKKLPTLGYENDAFSDTLKTAGAVVDNLTGQQYEDLGGFLYNSVDSFSAWLKDLIAGRASYEAIAAIVALVAVVAAFFKFCR